MKYGRRRKRRSIAADIAAKRRAFEREVREQRLREPPEHIVSIEIMCIALASFRTSDEWKALGWWGRWLSLWRHVNYAINPRVLVLSCASETYNFHLGQVVAFRGSPPLYVTSVDRARGIITVDFKGR